jgi:hypothetical protein
MIEWLNETEDAPADIKLWGFECDIYQWAHLEAFIKRGREPLEDSSHGLDRAKAQTKKKKTHKKTDTKKADTKNKGKSRAKAASSSREESEPVQKSCKKHVASGSHNQ